MSKELFSFTPSSDVIESVRKEVGLDERRIKEAVDGIKSWLQLQPHLPDDEDDGRLERWLIRCKNNMEKVKQALDMYYSMKNIIPELLCDRDTNGSFMEEYTKSGYVVSMPGLTSQHDRVSVTGIWTSDIEVYNHCISLKVLLMGLEMRMCEDYYRKDIFIVDLKHATIQHVSKVSVPLFKKYLTFLMNACSIRLAAIHIVNVPPNTEMFINMFKKLMKPKLANRVHIHRTDFTELHKQVPIHLLPTHLGGTGQSVKELSDQFLEKIKSYHDWFIRQEQVKVDESKRPPGQNNYSDMFRTEGSFRQLSID